MWGFFAEQQFITFDAMTGYFLTSKYINADIMFGVSAMGGNFYKPSDDDIYETDFYMSPGIPVEIALSIYSPQKNKCNVFINFCVLLT